MRIVVDRNARATRETFGRHGELLVLDGRSICRGDLLDADALIVRTTTRVNADLLDGTAVRFVGTTSIGTDHMDLEWLEREGITWAHAPGCNAEGTAQYTLALIWLASRRRGLDPRRMSLGIVGRGNVGSRLQGLAETLGMPCVANDPPLAERGVEGLVGLQEALAQDVISLHVPLTRDGPHPTYRLLDRARLARMRDGALLVNASRGDVIDGDALLAELESGRLEAALDVWPGEPGIDPRLLRLCRVATPHVAGYSDDGKLRGTQMVYSAFCRWAGLGQPDAPDLPAGAHLLELPNGDDPLGAALETTCFVARHDAALRELAEASPSDRAAGFDRLRRDYPSRRDFRGWRIGDVDADTGSLLQRLGFAAADG